MRLEAFFTKYLHSTLTLGLALIVFWATIHIATTYGPGFLKGPANTIGGLAGGQAYGF